MGEGEPLIRGGKKWLGGTQVFHSPMYFLRVEAAQLTNQRLLELLVETLRQQNYFMYSYQREIC